MDKWRLLCVCVPKKRGHTYPSKYILTADMGSTRVKGFAIFVHVGIKDEARTAVFLRTLPTHLLI